MQTGKNNTAYENEYEQSAMRQTVFLTLHKTFCVVI